MDAVGVVKPCPKCELPTDSAETLERHESFCVGVTPYVMHNRRAGMVVYLTEEEYAAMIDSNHARQLTGVEAFPAEMASNISDRALFGLADWEQPEGDTERWHAPPETAASADTDD